MYKKSIKVLPSKIDGKGVFANEDIHKDEIVWIFEPGHDLSISKDDFEKMSAEDQSQIEKIGYLSPWSNQWICPPDDDPARFTNHSKSNNLSAVYDDNVSKEPYFIANKEIKTGEELTNNYYEFDLLTQKSKPEWA